MDRLHFMELQSCSDATSLYDVKTDRKHREYTINELIDIVLSDRPHEWGEFDLYIWDDVAGRATKTLRISEYERGQLREKNNDVINTYGDYRPFRIRANGGWSCMDYDFYVKIKED